MLKKSSLLFAAALSLSVPLHAQNAGTGPVTKYTSGAPKNQITEDIKVGDGRTIDATGTGVINATKVGGYTPAQLPVSTATQTALDAKQPLDADLTRTAAGDLGVSVKTYGATADGNSVSDSSFFATAIAQGGRIYVPAGTYLLKTSVTISTAGVQIIGAGIGRTIIKTDADTDIFSVSASNVTIQGIEFQGKDQDYTIGQRKDTGVYVSSSVTGLNVSECRFYKLTSGIETADSVLAYSTIKKNRFDRISGPAIHTLGADYTEICGNVIEGSRSGIGDGYGTFVGIWPAAGSRAGVHNKITLNTIKYARYECIVTKMNSVTISNNTIVQTSGAGSGGIVIEGDSTNTPHTPQEGYFAIVESNILAGTNISIRYDPANVGTCPAQVIVDGNVVHDLTAGALTGIELVGYDATNPLRRSRIANNLVYGITNGSAGGYGVFVKNSKNVDVIGNQIEGCDLGIGVQSTATAATSGVVVFGNNVRGSLSEGINLYATASGAIDGIDIVENTFDSGAGSVTSMINFGSASDGAIANARVWRNRILGTATNALRLKGSSLVVRDNFAPSATNHVVYVGTLGVGYTVASSSVVTGQRNGLGGVTVPTAQMHLAGSTTAASSAPLKFDAGTLMTTPEAGAVEFDGSYYYFTVGSTRSRLSALGNSVTFPGGGSIVDNGSGRVDISSATGRDIRLIPGTGGSVIVSGAALLGQSYSSGTATLLSSSVTGDTGSNRFLVDASGKFAWGDGSTTRDTFLYRIAANTLKTDGGMQYGGPVKPGSYTAATLPAASSWTGAIAIVTDANATTAGTIVAGGGSNTVSVRSNGTNWIIY